MSNATETMVGSRTVARTGSPVWWIVCKRELADLWISGKAMYLTLIYTIVLGAMTYLLASNSELSLIPTKEMVYETIKTAMGFALFIGLIIGADSISGERERATLEAVLLTPTSRRQIVIGKFLAACSVWPVAMAIVTPYLVVLAQGDEVLGPAILWGTITGSLLAPAYVALGMLVSFWSSSNRTSYFVSLAMYIFFLVPAQLPGRAQTGAAGQFVQWVNPLAAVNHFLSKHLVNYRPVSEYGGWLTSPVVFLVLMVVLLIVFSGPRLHLEANLLKGRRSTVGRGARMLAVVVLAATLMSFPAWISQASAQGTQPVTEATDLKIDIDKVVDVVKTSDKVEFITTVQNNADKASPPLIVAMNVINLDAKGDIVDPEDWAPQRTQYLESLPPGQTAKLNWIINTILDGDYMVYMVVIPAPTAKQTSTLPVASAGLHLTVTPYTKLNPAGILPYAIGGPLVLGVLIFAVVRLRRRQIDTGASSASA